MNKEELGVFGRSIFSHIIQSLQDLNDWAIRTVRYQTSFLVLQRFIFSDQGSIPLLPYGLAGDSLLISSRHGKGQLNDSCSFGMVFSSTMSSTTGE